MQNKRKIKIKGKEIYISYKTSSTMYTTEVIFNKKVQLGVDVYNVEGSDDICLMGNTDRGHEYFNTATVITAKEYQDILDKWDNYNHYPYHSSLVDLIRPVNYIDSHKNI